MKFIEQVPRSSEGIVHGDGDGSCRHDGTYCRRCDGVGGDNRERHVLGIIETWLRHGRLSWAGIGMCVWFGRSALFPLSACGSAFLRVWGDLRTGRRADRMADCGRMLCGRGSPGRPASSPGEAFLLVWCIRKGRNSYWFGMMAKSVCRRCGSRPQPPCCFIRPQCVISCLFLSPINHVSLQWAVESIQTFADRTIVRPSVPRGFTGGKN